MTERLKLVTDFGELRAGMIVVVKPCGCGAAHRGMLIGPVTGHPEYVGLAFTMLPSVHCDAGGWRGRERCVGRPAVAGRMIHRVEDGLESSSSQKATTRNPKTVQA